MRYRNLMITGAAVLIPVPVQAADTLKFGPQLPWVVPQHIPADSSKSPDSPVVILLSDTQIRFEPGKKTSFTEVAMKVQTANGLSAANITLPWQPSTDTVTINKLHIIRHGKVIDVLASGQTFTTLRRETNLEAASLDGTLTAAIQPEGVQLGDIIDLAATDEHVDPVLGTHVETTFGSWNSVPIELGHVRLSWPSTMAMAVRQSGSLPELQRTTGDGMTSVELTARSIQPLLLPKGAPARFRVGRFGETSDFHSWSEISDLMRPLYDQAAVIPETGPLRDELEAIRKGARSPNDRAEKALKLVEGRVRYVAMEMGAGGYTPAPAKLTWSRRFGDCKGKTVLLLALLHELGIEAEPVLVHHSLGDILPDRLPLVAYFDHVIVRAHVAGKSYWLDGTRTDDTRLDSIPVPDFEWGLPLVSGATLVAITPQPLTSPLVETRIDIDSTAGAFAPAHFKVAQTVRGDSSVALKTAYAAVSPAQSNEALKQYWRSKYDDVETKSVGWTFDDKSGELHLTMDGSAKLDWNGGLYVPGSTVAFKPDFERSDGPFHDAPFSLNFPDWETTEVQVHLPPRFATKQKKMPPDVEETVAGIHYAREVRLADSTVTVDTSERTLRQELPYKEAIAAEGRLRALYDDDVYLEVPNDYRPTNADFAGLAERKPASASEFVWRGNLYMDSNKMDEAIADFTEAHRLDPGSVWALADRAMAYIWKQDFANAKKDLEAAKALESGNGVLVSGNEILLRGRALLAEANDDPEAAIDYFTKSLEKDPGNSFALTHRANLLSGLDRFDDAVRDMNAVVASEPGNANVLAARGLIYVQEKDYTAARKDVAAALAIDPANTQALQVRGIIAAQQGDQEGAIQIYSKALDTSPADPTVLALRAQAYHAAGEDAKALEDTQAAAKGGAIPSQLRLLRANIFRASGKHQLAVNEAELLMKENPGSTFALVAAGKILSAEGQSDRAMEALDRALAIHPYAYIYMNRAEIRRPTDFAARLSDIDKALALEPDQPDALQIKAWILLHQEKYTDSIIAFDAALANKPADPADLRRGRAVALYKAGRQGEAEKEFTELRAEAKDPSDFNLLCWQKATAGILLESALDDCKEALKSEPGTAAYNDSMGLVYLRLGKLDDALNAYTAAIDKAKLADSYMGRALAYAGKGDVARSNSDRAQAIKLNPEVEEWFAEYGLQPPVPAAGPSRQPSSE